MIEREKYLTQFRKTGDLLDKNYLKTLHIEMAVGEILDCVFLKLYKKSWASPGEDAFNATSRIFFSIWASDESNAQQIIRYNIHALKLRQLPAYSIESRKFAEKFRERFKKHQKQWPNVSVQFGPLTLMEGWVNTNTDSLQEMALKLSNQFLELASLIDDTLAEFKK